MKTMEIIANYGVLGHEKKPVYTHEAEHIHAACSEAIIVKLPDGFDTAEGYYGPVLVDPDGKTYNISDCLRTGKNEEPVLAIPCGSRWDFKYYSLEIVESIEE